MNMQGKVHVYHLVKVGVTGLDPMALSHMFQVLVDTSQHQKLSLKSLDDLRFLCNVSCEPPCFVR